MLRQRVVEPGADRHIYIDPPRWEDRATGMIDVGRDPSSQLFVALRPWVDPEAEQGRTVQETDREEPVIGTPGSHGGRRGVGSEPPEPAEVTRVQLHGRVVSLPAPQRGQDLVELVDAWCPEPDPHGWFLPQGGAACHRFVGRSSGPRSDRG